jgi:hypothetical protein
VQQWNTQKIRDSKDHTAEEYATVQAVALSNGMERSTRIAVLTSPSLMANQRICAACSILHGVLQLLHADNSTKKLERTTQNAAKLLTMANTATHTSTATGRNFIHVKFSNVWNSGA